MKYLCIFIIVFVLFTNCKETNNPYSPNQVELPTSTQLIETSPLPVNTVTVIDFDRTILGEGKTLIIADISDSNNIQTISQFELETQQYYNSIQLD